LSRHVYPRIATRVLYEEQSNQFQYDYTFYDCAQAKQSALLWYLVDVIDRQKVQVQTPLSWSYNFPNQADEQIRSNPIHRSLAVMVENGPKTSESASGVPPGVYRRGLQLTSKILPGLTSVYVQGKSHIPKFPSEPPDEIADSLKRVLGFPYNYRKACAFGPKYPAAMSRDDLAKFFTERLRRFSN
jgi:hypothetical protein